MDRMPATASNTAHTAASVRPAATRDANVVFDVAVLGGGASGLACALSAARTGAHVLVIERDVACGLPILATGNGRCNLANIDLDPARYRHPRVARAAMGTQPFVEVARFLRSVGIVTAEEAGRLYPYSFRAASVRDALLGACRRAGVETRCGAELAAARFEGGAWRLAVREPAHPLHPKQRRADDERRELRALRKALETAPRIERTVSARAAVIAVGGRSEAVAARFGLPHLTEAPVLCPVAGELIDHPGALDRLNGLRVRCGLSLRRVDEPAWSTEGELLFRPYGISGIAVFDLSRRAEPGDLVELDLFPSLPKEEPQLAHLLDERQQVMGSLGDADASWFDGLLAPQLAHLFLPSAGVTPHALAERLHRLRFRVSGLAEPDVAQVRRGGIPCSAIEPPSMRVRPDLAPALYACGEAVDMDADCGGFNLAWAWLSGSHAGNAAAAAAQER